MYTMDFCHKYMILSYLYTINIPAIQRSDNLDSVHCKFQESSGYPQCLAHSY